MLNIAKNDLIIRTKLYQPQLSKTHLHRRQIVEKLHIGGQHVPLTLVSAPAGYGKSTSVSSWLDTCKTPSAWISLDEGDNDLQSFLSYFVSAIQQLFPDKCSKSFSFLNIFDPPPNSVVNKILINELEQIKQEFILVLDDYHVINDEAIHQLLIDILKYPSVSIRLVLTCRHNPPLPIIRLRAKGQITEIRIKDLRFSLTETQELLEQISDTPIDQAVASTLEAKTEGWVTGLCLAGLTLRNKATSPENIVGRLAENQYVIDYFISEFVAHQPQEIQICIQKCAILNRFCTSLCDAICGLANTSVCTDTKNKDFFQMFLKEMMFVISLDDHDEWFRFHHLLQALLQNQLKKNISDKELSNLHKQASLWFADNGFVDEAIFHALESGEQRLATSLVKQYRHDIVKREQWFHLSRWLQKFPAAYIQEDPELLLTQAWIYQRQASYSKLFETLDKIEKLKHLDNTIPCTTSFFLGEVQVLRSFQYYSTGQPLLTEETARSALNHLPHTQSSNRGFAYLMVSAALQMQGDTQQAYLELHEEMQQEEALLLPYKNALLVAFCYVSWISADSKKLKSVVLQLVKHGQENQLSETLCIGCFFSGILHYQQNNLELAEQFLRTVVTTHGPVDFIVPNIVTYCQSSFALSLTYLAMGRLQDANDVVDTVIDYMLETNNSAQLEICQAFQAELSLRTGKISEASFWLKNYWQRPLAPAYRFYTVDLTVAHILLAQRTVKSLQEVEVLLSKLYTYHNERFSCRMLIEILGLQVSLYVVQSRTQEATDKLQAMFHLAEPAGFVRPFLNCGPEVVHILADLAGRKSTTAFIKQVYEDFKNEVMPPSPEHVEAGCKTSSPSPKDTLPSLSHREIEVLRMLASGMSNKKLSSALNISPETIKCHLSNIYCKLNVSSRLQAVIAGKSLGIL